MTARDALAPILYDLDPKRDQAGPWDSRPDSVQDYWRAVADLAIPRIRTLDQADAEDLVGGKITRPPVVTGSIWGVRKTPAGPVRVMEEAAARRRVASPAHGGTLVRYTNHEWQEVPP